MPSKSTRRAQRAKLSDNTTVPESSVPKIRRSIPDSVRALGISRAKIYQRIKEGALHPVYDGRRIFLTDDELRRYAETSRP